MLYDWMPAASTGLGGRWDAHPEVGIRVSGVGQPGVEFWDPFFSNNLLLRTGFTQTTTWEAAYDQLPFYLGPEY